MDVSHYFITPAASGVEELLRDWRWLVADGGFTLHGATAMGDLFLRDDRGAIHFLDTSGGEFYRVAGSDEELSRLLDDRNHRRTLLLSFLLREMRRRGVNLDPGQCYSTKIPEALGGEGVPENLEPTNLLVHLSVMGQLLRQLKELPPGSRIDEVKMTGLDA